MADSDDHSWVSNPKALVKTPSEPRILHSRLENVRQWPLTLPDTSLWLVDSMRAVDAEWRDGASLICDLDAELRETIAHRTDPERAADYRRQ